MEGQTEGCSCHRGLTGFGQEHTPVTSGVIWVICGMADPRAVVPALSLGKDDALLP